MKLATSLESIQGAIRACLKCNGCTYGAWPANETVCPLFARDQCFTHSAGGLLFLSRAVLTGQMEYNQRLADLAFTCSACRACDSKCVIVRCINPDMALSDIIRLLRYELVKRGFVPEGRIKEMYDEVRKNGDLSAKGEKALTPPKRKREADTVLVVEAIHDQNLKKSYGAALRLLEKIGKPIELLADQGTFGSTLYDFGFWEQLPALVKVKSEKLKALGDKKLLFLDPHCQEFVTNMYPKILDNGTAMKGQHISEVLLEGLTKGKLKGKPMKKVKVSYHDPCFLGRGLGIYEPPREVLKRLGNVELVEMKRSKDQSFCCGARGLGSYFEGFAERTASMRVNDFLATKADLLITACPSCKEVLGNAMGNSGLRASRVKDLTEFVNERVA
jgi:Fe-S oxidoreductase